MQGPNHLLLIALNMDLSIPRAHLCRLAETLTLGWTQPQEALDTLARKIGVPSRSLGKAQNLLKGFGTRARGEIERARRLGAEILSTEGEGYPEELRATRLAPPVLYVLGELPRGQAISIVGSRRPDHYGREAAHFFGHHLAQRGVTIISGFARGIDEAAHRGALAHPQGRTVAVLGCGVDVAYPSHREEMVRKIRERGALVSEFPLGTAPLARNFPVRNRIIAAMGESTLVVQATPRSGSLITARYALELGREVFALPGRIFDETALGPNALLRDGAAVALHPDDLIPDLQTTQKPPAEEPEPPLSAKALRIWKAVPRGDTVGTDEIAKDVEIRVDQVLAVLLELELGGWVQRHAGATYSRSSR